MRTLLITHTTAGDYGVDGLAHGFACLGEVIDWPVKAQLHGQPNLNSYPMPFSLPRHMWGEAEVRAAIADRAFDVVVLGDCNLETLAHARSLGVVVCQDRCVLYDAADDRDYKLAVAHEVLGFYPARFFKRELPIDAQWALPLGFGYPEDRIMIDNDDQRTGACFIAAYTPDRAQLATLLRNVPGVSVALSHHYGDRLVASDFQTRYRQALVGISPAGFFQASAKSPSTWMCYRHFEVAAWGCCPVISTPLCQWLNGFQDGREARYFRDPDEAKNVVQALLNEPTQARAIGRAARQAILTHHTTRAIANSVMRALSGLA